MGNDAWKDLVERRLTDEEIQLISGIIDLADNTYKDKDILEQVVRDLTKYRENFNENVAKLIEMVKKKGEE